MTAEEERLTVSLEIVRRELARALVLITKCAEFGSHSAKEFLRMMQEIKEKCNTVSGLRKQIEFFMAYITTCPGTGCPQKESCYRFTAKREELGQSYFVTPPLISDGSCDYYWSNKERDEKEDLSS